MRWPNCGCREKVERISEIAAIAATITETKAPATKIEARCSYSDRLAALAGVEEDAAVMAIDDQHRERGEEDRATTSRV